MKIIVLAVICLLNIDASAQSKLKMAAQPEWFAGLSLDSAKALADSFVAIAHHKYVYKSDGGSQDKIIYFYEQQDGEKSELGLAFNKRMIGVDKDLEIPGHPRYYVDFYGRFLDIFPFWKKYVDPEATTEKLLANRYETHKFIVQPEKNGFDMTVILRSEQDGVWSIIVR